MSKVESITAYFRYFGVGTSLLDLAIKVFREVSSVVCGDASYFLDSVCLSYIPIAITKAYFVGWQYRLLGGNERQVVGGGRYPRFLSQR